MVFGLTLLPSTRRIVEVFSSQSSLPNALRHAHLSKGKLPVVPANAGTHNHRLEFVARTWDGFPSDNKHHAVWVPAFAGTTDDRLLFETYTYVSTPAGDEPPNG